MFQFLYQLLVSLFLITGFKDRNEFWWCNRGGFITVGWLVFVIAVAAIGGREEGNVLLTLKLAYWMNPSNERTKFHLWSSFHALIVRDRAVLSTVIMAVAANKPTLDTEQWERRIHCYSPARAAVNPQSAFGEATSLQPFNWTSSSVAPSSSSSLSLLKLSPGDPLNKARMRNN